MRLWPSIMTSLVARLTSRLSPDIDNIPRSLLARYSIEATSLGPTANIQRPEAKYSGILVETESRVMCLFFLSKASHAQGHRHQLYFY